jgi:polyketide synthase 5
VTPVKLNESATMQTRVTPVAVIGMACRLPGGIDSPELLWQALISGADLVTEIPPDRWDADEYYDSEPGVPGRAVSKWGAFLDDVAGFDCEFFGIGESEATAIDPQHRLLLETCWEAVEHGGLTRQAMVGSQTGVFAGLTHDDYTLVAADADALEGPYGFYGTSFSMASGRVAYEMGLQGPAITLDTACSSGLAAVHLACRSLHEGESELALAGGVSLTLDPRKFISGSALGVSSPTGRCRAFDTAADGFVVGEGCVVVLLKRQADAQRDGDRILAVLRGTAVNQDGRTVNIATPSRRGQVAAYRAALDAAGVDAATVGMVEAHGPGTPVGDPIEYASLAEVYGREHPCALASLKTNFGHTQSAAGTLGLAKAVLALQHGVVPQNLHFTRLPEALTQIDTKLFVPQEITSWPHGHEGPRGPRRAAVSSYGMSGTNVHAIVEQAPGAGTHDGTHDGAHDNRAHDNGEAGSATTDPLLFPLSSTSAEGLRRTAGRLAEWVHNRAERLTLPDLAYTLARRRWHRPVRTAALAGTPAELTDALRAIADADTAYQAAVGLDDMGPVWVFSGQGSQWAAMGAELLALEPVFAATIAEVEPLIAGEAGFSVTEAMTAAQTITGIARVQPTLFAMQIALAATLRSHGVQPGAVIGHSFGEAAAAVVSGALTLPDGVRVICRRSQLMSRLAGAGAMASVELPAQQVVSELKARGITDVVVSVVASPQSTVIGGAAATVRALIAEWEQSDVMAREVVVDVASHSPQVDPILDELAAALHELTPVTPTVPYYSATLFDAREQPVCDGRYWVNNLRRMVRFGAAVHAALDDGHRVFAELSPHPLLIHAVERTAAGLDMPVAALAAMRREQPLRHGLRPLVADLHNSGAAVDFSRLYPSGHLVDAPLPVWTHRHLLLNGDGRHRDPHAAHAAAQHPLLGAHVQLMEEPERHVWQAEVGTAALPWLGDHQIHQTAAFPGAAYCEMALAAAQQVLGAPHEVRDIRFEHMLLLDDQTRLGATASVKSPGVFDFVVHTAADAPRTAHATATLQAVDDECPPPAHDIGALRSAHARRIDGQQLRETFHARGIQFGPAFTGVAAAHAAEHNPEHEAGTVLAEVGLPAAIRAQQSAYGIHPALLDACFQSIAAHPHLHGVGADRLLLPLGIRRLRAYAHTRNARYCYVTAVRADAAGAEADLDVLDQDGSVVLTARGLRLGTGASPEANRDRLFNDRLLTVQWRQQDPPTAAEHAGSWVLISTQDAPDAPDALPGALSDALERHGAQCETQCWPARLSAYRGVVLVCPPPGDDPDRPGPAQDPQQVRQLVRIGRELTELAGDSPRLYLVTRQAQKVEPGDRINLGQAGLRGLMRVIGTEHPHLRATQIDVDQHSDAQQIAQQLLSGCEEDETAWRNGRWYAARLCRSPLQPGERRTAVADYQRDGLRLQIRTPGDLETMELAAAGRVAPQPGQIEVAVTASSINFADVLIAFGRYPSIEGHLPQLGTDFAGVVTAVGPGVTDHRVGDHVGGLSPNGCWGTFVVCDASLAAKIPPGLTDAQAAAVSTAHATAWFALHELARITAGDRVLIHSATGGVGQAAIAIARAAGAEIFATAGSSERRQLLCDMGIEHVYASRSIDFAEEIRRDTDGYGVDIVLNSLSGTGQRAGLELLSWGGRFIEIGKSDIYGDTRLGLLPFRRNLAFYALDIAMLGLTHPRRIQRLLSTVYRLVADGALPLPQATHWPLAEAANAIRVMAAAEHTGKLVLDIPRVGHSAVVVPARQAQVFRPDGSYIITGGLGGLGRFLAARMASPESGAGCGRIVLTSRSQPSPDAEQDIEHIRATGADIVVECGDIAQADMADRLVSVATGTGLALRGVLHAAAVVEDATCANISDELIERDWAPKVYGAWNLHRATAGQPLDWFCSFSSAAALLGSPGQGAYAAANSWLDAFTHWRRTQGLPATAIAWGAWAEIGRATDLAARSDTAITPDEGAYAFEALLSHERAHTGYAPITGIPWFAALAQHSRFVEALQSGQQSASGTSKFRAELDALPAAERLPRVRRLIAEQVSLILRHAAYPDRPFTEYGMDSLGILELRTRIESETGIRLTPKDIATHNTVRDLGLHLCETLTGEPAVP